MSHKFLLEVLCEEIPANALPAMRRQLEEGFDHSLHEAGFPKAKSRALSTVRRIVVHVAGLTVRQPDRKDERTGPPEKAAFDHNGAPTQAAIGFARGQGASIDDLRVVDGPKGRVVAVRKRIPGRPTVEVLAGIVPTVFSKLHFPKTMRWGRGEHAFVRPVHNVLALLGEKALDEIVPVELFGVKAGSSTFGHRVTAPGPVDLLGVAGIDEYCERLRDAGVEIDQDTRRTMLAGRAARLAAEVGCAVRQDPDLMAEHVELVEYPGVLRGKTPERFLELPEEVLVTTLRHHQKCLVLEKDGKVAPYFLAVCDRADDPEGHVVTGNEWVAGARLADAEFFFEQDRKKRLDEHAKGLDRVTFHQKLGSYHDKVKAVNRLCRSFVGQIVTEDRWPDLERAALLAKADLVTAMVGEFPELQGVIGGIYARLDGETEAAWQAIYDQYTPAGLDGEVPRGPVGAILGVADRLDTLTGLFAAGDVPTGSKDPFALRRAALAMVKICAAAPLEIDLRDALESALRGREKHTAADRAEVLAALREFVRDRERFYLTTVTGVSGEVADAALGARWGVIPDDIARATALQAVREEPVFADLAVAFKRVRNIVAKAEPGKAAPNLLREPAEVELRAAMSAVAEDVDGSAAAGDYASALRALASLAPPLDRFFTDVLVMDEDVALRAARIALLRELEALFLMVADVSRLAAQV